jgi:REP-associated tyrosine transposase
LPGSIGRIVQAFKSITTHEYIIGVKQSDWMPFPGKLWQRDYWEHIVRNDNEMTRIMAYIRNNPQQWRDDKLNGGSGNIFMEQTEQYGNEIWMV